MAYMLFTTHFIFTGLIGVSPGVSTLSARMARFTRLPSGIRSLSSGSGQAAEPSSSTN